MKTLSPDMNGLIRISALLLLLHACAPCARGQVPGPWEQLHGPGDITIENPVLPAVYAFAVAPSTGGTDLFTGTFEQGVFLSTNDGSSWSQVDSGLTNTDVFSLLAGGSNLYAGTWDGGVFLSTNNGVSWQRTLDTGNTNSEVISLAAIGSSVFKGTYGGGVYVTYDSGAVWDSIGPPNTVVYSFAVTAAGLFAGTYQEGVLLRPASGPDWIRVNSGLTDTAVDALATDGTNIWAGTMGGGVFFSADSGASWTAASAGLTDLTINALAVIRGDLFAATNGGVFHSNNSGKSWTAINQGLPATNIYSLGVTPTSLLAGTIGYGVYRHTLSDITSVNRSQAGLPGLFRLEQNFPNPFNPATTIRYSIPLRVQVTLKVFNTLGQVVATLIHGEQEPGSHEVRFDGGSLASGVYFYRLTAGGFARTMKLQVIR